MDMPSVLVSREPSTRPSASPSHRRGRLGVAELHGNLTKAQRTRPWKDSAEGLSRFWWQQISRRAGLDVDDITHVISFDVPNVPDDYVIASAALLVQKRGRCVC